MEKPTLAQADTLLRAALQASSAAGYGPTAVVVLDEAGHLSLVHA